jgi:hypothetical protein
MRSAYSLALARFSLPLLFATAAGCASDKDRVEKQLSKLRDEVAHLQSETDRMGERMDAMEGRQAAVPHYAEERVAQAQNSGTVSRPKLKVVRMEPGDVAAEPEAEQADAPAPDADTGRRVIIQGEGKSLESRTVPGTAPIAAKTAKPEAAKPTKAEAAKPTKSDAAKPGKGEGAKSAKPDASPAK